MDVKSVLDLLGRTRERPIGSRRYRSIVATKHRFSANDQWDWRPQESEDAAIAGVIFAAPTNQESGQAATPRIGDRSRGSTYFLHPFRENELLAAEDGVSVCIWVPWKSLVEVDSGLPTVPFRMPSTPLGLGLRAFAESLFSNPSTSTVYSDFLIEQALTEMVFGVVVEASAVGSAELREPKLVDRARSIMLIRRQDPELSVDEIAYELHVSERQLQRAFAAEGTTPAKELRELRIELARTLLRNPALRPLSMKEIAQHAGFRNSASLRRAFAAAGLPTPNRAKKAADGY